MNELLMQYLGYYDVTFDDVSELISNFSSTGGIVYSSILEGLGTKESDLDVYLFENKLPVRLRANESESTVTIPRKLNNLSIDIKVWEKKYILKLIQKLNSESKFEIDSDELKMLCRIRKGIAIRKEMIMEIKELINVEALTECILRYYILNAQSEFQDASALLKAGELQCALHCARVALHSTIGAYNTSEGVLNVKEKWIPKLFIDNENIDKKIKDKYIYYQCHITFDNSTIEKNIKDMLNFIRDLLTEIRLYK